MLVPRLGLPPSLTRYLLYNIALDEVEKLDKVIEQHEERIKQDLPDLMSSDEEETDDN